MGLQAWDSPFLVSLTFYFGLIQASLQLPTLYNHTRKWGRRQNTRTTMDANSLLPETFPGAAVPRFRNFKNQIKHTHIHTQLPIFYAKHSYSKNISSSLNINRTVLTITKEYERYTLRIRHRPLHSINLALWKIHSIILSIFFSAKNHRTRHLRIDALKGSFATFLLRTISAGSL